MPASDEVSDDSAAGPELLARLRHDLRTPINHIVGYAELLGEEAAEGGWTEFSPDLERICQAGRELLAQVNRQLDPARVEAGGIDRTDLDERFRNGLNAVIGYADLLSEEAEARGLSEPLEHLERIRTAGLRLLALVGALPEIERPHAPASAEPEPPRPARPTEPALVGARLLVVEDDPASRELLERRLRRLGATVTLAEDGQIALELLARGETDLVLLDLWMPRLDGFQVLTRMKAEPTLRELPVIVLSASDDLAGAVRCIELGAEDYLPKPVETVLLRARIGAALEKKRLRDEQRRHLETIQAQAMELATWNRELEARVSQQVEELERVSRLRRFLSPQVAGAIESGGGEALLASHRRLITVVFCDLRGFTGFAETAEPEEVMGVLSEYHAALGALIHEHEGTLERFTGDGLMIFFNDPLPCPDPAERAVRMAVAMRQRVAELAVVWRRQGHRLDFGMGIAMGYATLGQIGFEGRSDYAAIGTVTNLAARLCGEAGPGQILVSERVQSAVEELAECEPVGELTLKGFARPVSVANVTGVRPAG